MPETELYKRIEELESENELLRNENKRLREVLGFALEDGIMEEPVDLFENEVSTTVPLINKYSSPQEKIELYMSLFRGRTDVYAKRYFSKQIVYH